MVKLRIKNKRKFYIFENFVHDWEVYLNIEFDLKTIWILWLNSELNQFHIFVI